MSAPVRYSTSFVATICHIISGLSIIAAVLWVVPAVAFFFPSVVTGVGQSLGIDLTTFVSDVQTSSLTSTVTLLGSFLALVASFVAMKAAGDRLYAVGRPSPAARQGAGGTGAQTATAHQQPAASVSTDYVDEFGKMSYVMAGLMALVFVAFGFLFRGALLSAGFRGGGALVQLVGVFMVVYALVGYGARKGSMEAVVAGTLVYSVTLLGGLVTLNPFGVIIGGFGVYYGARSLPSGRLELLVFDAVQEQVANSRQHHGAAGPQSTQRAGPTAQQNASVTETGAGQHTSPQQGHGPGQQSGTPMETQQVAPGEQTERQDSSETNAGSTDTDSRSTHEGNESASSGNDDTDAETDSNHGDRATDRE